MLAVCAGCGAIQKIPDARWLEEIGRIYGNYEIYHQSAGSEQLIFGAGGETAPRSQRLVDHIVGAARLPATGKLLDIGCGNGATLRNFSRALPGWELYGCELSTATLDELRRIPNFKHLYTTAPAEIGERFPLVSMIHTLEHLQRPGEALSAAGKLLASSGTLFIEVPDIETSPFDLLVADHLLHFTRATLGFLATRSGLAIVTLSNAVISKEITLLAQEGRSEPARPNPGDGRRIAQEALAWLEKVVASAREAARSDAIGIFGTAIAGMALYGAVRDRVRFFVDEDPHRIGRRYDGKPVLGLADAPKDVPIILALPPAQARPLAERCARAGLTAIAPPALSASADGR
jgi:SAM-dependent methyltransferase